MNDNPLHLEWDSDGLVIRIDLSLIEDAEVFSSRGLDLESGGRVRGRLSTSEALHLYEHVQEVLGAWYAEAVAARSAVARGVPLAEFTGTPDGSDGVAVWPDAYAPDDPKSPGYYDRAVSVWDNREGK
jgi:hypothetical protein